MKKKVVVVFPGRGTYNKSELGHLKKYHGDKKNFINSVDQFRKEQGLVEVSQLDAMDKFDPVVFNSAENAAHLIYTCALCDFYSLDPDQYEVVAMCGNSMGWYLALAASGVLDTSGAINLIHTMGDLTAKYGHGAQLIFPLVDESWKKDSSLSKILDDNVAALDPNKNESAYISIRFGGYAVVGGSSSGIKKLMSTLPKVHERFPFKLLGTKAFHTPLLAEVPGKAFKALGADLFSAPQLPLIDGRGKIYYPHSTNLTELYIYTLERQVVSTYDFSKSIEVALKEFAPDHLLLTGPGTTVGGAIGQCLVEHNWGEIDSKESFSSQQAGAEFLLSMGKK
ncbi:MAG: ACP S-malonyltransferase [Bacteriovoracaceae bacterium]|jgi:[acyl-carrier-protein] S-malonyltransferase|nr:ACP S-malonyltransferase [Bacteriovoracaceae bacterium]